MRGRGAKRAFTWVVLALAIGGAGCEQVANDLLDRFGHGHGHNPGDGGTPVPEEPPPMTTLPAGSICIRDHWCYEHPFPHGLDQGPVWASSAHDIWVAAKYEPVLLHADADRWTVVDVPAPTSFVSVLRGGRPAEPWALAIVGPQDMAAFRREGGSWVEKKRWPAIMFDFYVAPSGDAWVPVPTFMGGRYDSTVDQFDVTTQTWTTIGTFPATLIYSVWASGPNDVWAAGRAASGSDADVLNGVTYHFDGVSWTLVPAAVVGFAQRIRGSAPDDVWLAGTGLQGAGAGPVVARLVGGAWQAMFSRQTAALVNDLEVPARGDVWAAFDDAVFHSTDAAAGAAATWNRIDAPVNNFDVAPTGAVTMVGARGELWFAATENEAPHRLTIGPRQSTVAIWGTSTTSQWVVGVDDAGAGALLHVTPAGTTQIPLPAGSERASAIWAASDQDIWITGNGGLIVHGSGVTGTFTVLPAPNPSDNLTGLWGSGPDDVWIAGGHTVLRWNGAAFESPAYGGFAVMDVAGSGPDDVWVVGEKVARLRAGAWTVGEVPAVPVAPEFDAPSFASDVWVNGQDEVFVGTERKFGQFVWRGDGGTAPTAWTLLKSSTNGYAADLFGARSGDLWSTGPYIGFHWDGYEVTYEDTLFNNRDARFWGVTPDNMWAATSGSVLHRQLK